MTDELETLLATATQLDHTQLDAEFARVPGDLAYYTQQYADATRAAMLAEWEYKRTRAQVAQATRRMANQIGEKLTEGGLSERLDADDRLNTLKLNEIDAETDKVRLRGVVQAIAAKADMLVSLGAHVRHELDNRESKRINESD